MKESIRNVDKSRIAVANTNVPEKNSSRIVGSSVALMHIGTLIVFLQSANSDRFSRAEKNLKSPLPANLVAGDLGRDRGPSKKLKCLSRKFSFCQ